MIKRLFTWRSGQRARRAASEFRTEPLDNGIGAEAPIRTISQDRLRRGDYASRIADVLSELSPREGRVFSIRGGWGFGKSSLKNLITEKLDATGGDVTWLDFNPWQWGKSDAIARALFNQLADRLGNKHSSASNSRSKALRQYGAILTGAEAPLKAVLTTPIITTVLANVSLIGAASAIGFDLPTVGKVAAVLAVLAVCLPFIGRFLGFLGRDNSGESLDEVRNDLRLSLGKLSKPAIVFVDDIDRLDPEQIRELIRQVKANANLPNIVFVLIFQSNIVERALAPIADGDGRAFLEKIVQANFDLPSVPVENVYRLFEGELNELIGEYATEENGFLHTRWGNALVGCIRPHLRNIRDSRRLISSIAVHMPLHIEGRVFEVNIVDFILLETIRVFEPGLHQALFKEQDFILQPSPREGRWDADKLAADKLVAVAAESNRSALREALRNLFPNIEWAFGGVQYAGGHRAWFAAKRVCTARYFPRYFELQTLENEISENRFVELLEASANDEVFAVAIAKIEADGFLQSLAARFDESIERLPPENANVLLPSMFIIAEKLVGWVNSGPFNSPWVAAWRATSWYLEKIPRASRATLVLEALRRTEALSVVAIIIHLNDPADHSEGNAFNPSLDYDVVKTLKFSWLEIIRKLAQQEKALLNKLDLVSLLYRWRDYSGSIEEPREWVSKIISTKEGFASICTRIMSRGVSYSSGDLVSKSYNSFDKKTVIEFIGVSEVEAILSNITPDDFPEHKESLRALALCLESWQGLIEN